MVVIETEEGHLHEMSMEALQRSSAALHATFKGAADAVKRNKLALYLANANMKEARDERVVLTDDPSAAVDLFCTLATALGTETETSVAIKSLGEQPFAQCVALWDKYVASPDMWRYLVEYAETCQRWDAMIELEKVKEVAWSERTLRWMVERGHLHEPRHRHELRWLTLQRLLEFNVALNKCKSGYCRAETKPCDACKSSIGAGQLMKDSQGHEVEVCPGVQLSARLKGG